MHRPALLSVWFALVVTVTAAEPARLIGSFAAEADDVAARIGSAPGSVWHSAHPDGSARGRLELPLPALPATLALNTAGYPNNGTLRLELASPDGGRRLKLSFRSVPGPDWTLYRWDIPPDWRGRPAVLVARDESPEQWIGVGLVADPAPARTAAWSALRNALAATALTILPFFIALVLLRPRFGRDGPLHVALALAGAGVFALAVFFGYFFARAAGHTVLLAGAVASLWAGRHLWREMRVSTAGSSRTSALRSLLSALNPFLAALLLAGAVAGTTWLYGGHQSPGEVPAGRHDLNLPSDNLIPEFFAEKIYHRQPLRPFMIDWLTSDRPPLQTGFLLQSRPLLADWTARSAAGMACQFAAFAGLWALLGAIGLPRRAAQLALLVCATSGFFVVNTAFAWPKLLPAGYLLAAAALLWRLARDRRRATTTEAVALGACAALAMLGHGGSFFALAAMAGLHLAFHGAWRDRRLLFAGGAVAALVYAPWSAYQKFADPPGDRLVKYHLAGRTAIDPRGSLAVIAESYTQTPAATIARNKVSNLRVLAGDFTNLLPSLATAAHEAAGGEFRRAWWRTANAVQGGAFFHLLQSLGVLSVGFVGLWTGRQRHRAWTDAGWYCVQVAATTIAVWCLLMFGPEGTVVHQGTYLTGALLHVACVIGLLAFARPVWRRVVLGLHFVLFAGIWTLSPAWNPWQDVLRPGLDAFWLTVLLASGGALLWIGRRLPVGADESAP